MSTNSMWRAIGALFVALPLACAPMASFAADAFPERPIRLIVPFPPGGSNDVLGRYMGIKLSERMGQQFVIDNRAGANGIIGAELAATSRADGYTLLFVSTSWVMNAAVRKLTYDVEKSFDPLGVIAESPNGILVNPKGPFGSIADVVAQARAKPGAISYAHTGVAGFNHFGGELFKQLTKTDMQHLPYKGGGPAMTDVIAGNVPLMFSSVTQALPHVRAGRLKMLAVGSQARTPVLPDTPTVIEAGVPGYEMVVWWGLAAPAGIPAQRGARILREINAVLDMEETRKRLTADAATPLRMTQAQMRKLVAADMRRWRDVAVSSRMDVQ